MSSKRFLSELAEKKSIEFILLNLHSLVEAGLYRGKAGLAITLFELSRHFKSELYEDYAYELIKEVLTYDFDNYTFNTGTSGIGFSIQYLIKNHYIDADYKDLYKEKQEGIEKHIKKHMEDMNYNMYEYVDYLFFIQNNEYIELLEKEKIKNRIVLNILNHLLYFETRERLKPQEIHDFYKYVVKILAVCNNTDIESIYCKRLLTKIYPVIERLYNLDVICTEPILGIHLLIYGIKNEKTELVEMGKKLFSTDMNNLSSPILSFKQKLDIAYYIHRIYKIDNSVDYRKVTNKVISSLVNSDIKIYEKNLFKSLCGYGFPQIGHGEGLSRLLLMNLYWNNIQEGEIPEHMIQLLN